MVQLCQQRCRPFLGVPSTSKLPKTSACNNKRCFEISVYMQEPGMKKPLLVPKSAKLQNPCADLQHTTLKSLAKAQIQQWRLLLHPNKLIWTDLNGSWRAPCRCLLAAPRRLKPVDGINRRVVPKAQLGQELLGAASVPSAQGSWDSPFPPGLPREELLIPTNPRHKQHADKPPHGHSPRGLIFILPRTKGRGQGGVTDRGLLATPLPTDATLAAFCEWTGCSGASLRGVAQQTGLGVPGVHVPPIGKQPRESRQRFFQAWPKLSCQKAVAFHW